MLDTVFRGHLQPVICLLFLCLLTHPISALAQSKDAGSALYPGLRSVLLAIAEVDQEVRSEMVGKGYGNLDSLDVARQQIVDETNIKILDKLVSDYGWPTREMVGRDGVKAAFLIVQHAEHAYQKQMLQSIKRSFERGDLDGGDYALLLDRVLVGDGLPQRYGSQAKIENGMLVLFPIEDKARVDEIRASMGLEPLGDYVRSLEQLYGMPARRF